MLWGSEIFIRLSGDPKEGKVLVGWGLPCAGIPCSLSTRVTQGCGCGPQRVVGGPLASRHWGCILKYVLALPPITPHPWFFEPDFLACLHVEARRGADLCFEVVLYELIKYTNIWELMDQRKLDIAIFYQLQVLVSSGPPCSPLPLPELKCLKILYNLCYCSCQEARWLGLIIEVTCKFILIHQCPSVPQPPPPTIHTTMMKIFPEHAAFLTQLLMCQGKANRATAAQYISDWWWAPLLTDTEVCASEKTCFLRETNPTSGLPSGWVGL